MKFYLQTESISTIFFNSAIKYRIAIFFILIIISVNFTFAQEYKSKPYFSVGFYSLDLRHTTNGLDVPTDPYEDENIFVRLVEALDLGFGYEFRLKDKLSIRTGADLFLLSFTGSHSKDSQKFASLRIPVLSIAINVSPRYYFLYVSDNGFFIEAPTKLGFSTSKAKFSFSDKDDFSTSKVTSNLHFQYGFSLGYRIGPDEDVGERSTFDISLGAISQNIGASINKLDLEQSEYFKNETLKKTTSLVLKMAINFSFKSKNRKSYDL